MKRKGRSPLLPGDGASRVDHEAARTRHWLPGRLGRIQRSTARLSPLVGGRRWTIAAIALGSAGAGLAEAGLLALIAQIATSLSTGAGHLTMDFGPLHVGGGVSILLVAAGIFALVRLFLQIVVVRLPARLSGLVQSQLRAQLFDSFLAAAWPVKAKEKEGHLQELMGGQTAQAGLAVLQLGNGFSAGLMFLALTVSAFVLSATVAVAVLATAVVLFAGLRPLSRRVRRSSAATSAASLEQAAGVAESVRMAEEVHVFGASDAERSKIDSLVRSVQRNYVRTRTLSATVPVLYQSGVIFLLVAGLALLYAIGTTRLAALGAVVLLLIRASSYGQQLQTAYQGLGESLPYLDRMIEAVRRYRENPAPSRRRPIDAVRTIEFASVSFRYRSDTPVLTDVTFAIKGGEAIGIVGPTGAGKSTLLQILLRLHDPSTGSYRVNGVAAAQFEDVAWHRSVSYLPQEPHVLNATVRDNIRFFRDWIGDPAIERAARLAHVHDDILSWLDGYQTIIGYRSNAVSGGQRQRICLARALAGAPSLLVLDEPTSSLDPQSEHLIQQSLEELQGQLTLIVVAHRVTTLSLCDRVMVLRNGHLEAFAPRELLYDSNDFYRNASDLLTRPDRSIGSRTI